MQEAFLHYLWQFQYFDKRGLCTTQGEVVQVFSAGNRNTHAGPDFFNARIKIGEIEWVGCVEIHINASGWIEHRHDADPAYENVVLHVVWKNDKPVVRKDGSLLPTIELKNKVDEQLLLQYKKLLNNPELIPCTRFFNQVTDLVKFSMLDKVLMQRLEAKGNLINELLLRNNNDWEETCYQLICRNFGFKVNNDPFLQLAQSLPYKVILKQHDKLIQIEALLFGQAGFLDDEIDDAYHQLLRREYHLLRQKYDLAEKKMNIAQWRFLRLRPANFPTIRLAQLAMLLFEKRNLFSKITEAANVGILRNLFRIRQSEYWLQHYQFKRKAQDEVSFFGDASIDTLIINTVVPLLVAYSRAKDEQRYMDQAVDVLHHIPAERNSITRQWHGNGLVCKTAFDSQALIELHHNFCMRRKCLDCNIGISLIKPVI